MVSRGYAWLDENIEHSDEDAARAAALAKKWSALETEREHRQFARMADDESGYCYDDEGEDETWEETKKRLEQERLQVQAEHDLEIELIEDKLKAVGARMTRPYEHWNEDERYVEYQERDREY